MSLSFTACNGSTDQPPRDRRRVLVLSQDFAVAGAQRQAVELAAGLVGVGYDVRAGVLKPGGPLTLDLEPLGIPIVEFPRRWRWDLSPAVRLADYLRRERIDIVHSFLFLPNFYARVAGLMARTPAIVTSLRSTGIEGWHRYALDIATSRMSHLIVANSDAGRTHYVRRGGPGRRMAVIKNGRRELPPPCDPVVSRRLHDRWGLGRFAHVIGMVACMERRKDHRLLVRALAPIVRAFPETGLVLVGDGSERAALEAEVASLGLEQHVVFAGLLRNPGDAYPLFDVYVQASASEEGISNSIMEAMAHRLPVIATDVGGNAEVVIDGLTGCIVPPRKTEALATAVLFLLRQPGLRQAMGEAGSRRVRSEFTIHRLLDATHAMYERLLVQARGHRNVPPLARTAST
jgi:glycosyltransferase involved in cell wall biosynthesis